MRAVIYREAGVAKEVLRTSEIPDPEPSFGELRVRISYSGVNPTDWKRRLGEPPQHGGFQVPHQDGSGIVDRVGDGVSPERLGERVWVFHAAIGHSFGTAAEYVCVPAWQAVPLPAEVSLSQGATLGIPYLTAAHALEYAPVRKGVNILVHGGAGAVGYAASQLARYMNARIVTTVSGEAKADIAHMARPDVVLNYRSAQYPTQLRDAAGQGFDLVTEVDLRQNLPTYVELLSLEAHVVAYASDGSAAAVPVRTLMFRNANVHFFVVYLLPRTQLEAAVAMVQGMIASQEVPTLPLHEYDFGDIATAHDDVQQGLVGRALIRIP